MSQTSATEPATEQAADNTLFVRFTLRRRQRTSLTCANASRRQSGLNANRLPTHRKVCSSRRCRSSRSIGELTRLAQVRGQDQRRAELRHRDRRLDIHFIHVRSKHENALPMIVTHGWPARSSSR